MFDRHLMVLQRSHLAAAQINWEDKATSDASPPSSTGLDSLVFG